MGRSYYIIEWMVMLILLIYPNYSLRKLFLILFLMLFLNDLYIVLDALFFFINSVKNQRNQIFLIFDLT